MSPAGAKRRAFTLGVDDDSATSVVAPRRQRPVDGQRHVVVERVQRLRPGEGDAPGAAVPGVKMSAIGVPLPSGCGWRPAGISLLPPGVRMRAARLCRRAIAGPVQPCLRPLDRKGQGIAAPPPDRLVQRLKFSATRP